MAVKQDCSSTGMQPIEFFDVGYIVNAHGIKGDVIIDQLSDVKDRLKKLKDAYLCSPDHQQYELIQISAKPHKGRWICQVSSILDRNQAEAHKGWYISITRQQAEPLPQGQFFVRDVIGYDVIDEDGRLIGRLKDVLTDRVQDLYQVERVGQQDLFFPGVPKFLLKIDTNQQQIRVKLPAGLEDVFE